MIENQQSNTNDDEADSPVPPNPMEPTTSGYDEKPTASTKVLENKKEPYWQRFSRRWIIVVCTVGLAVYTALLYTLTVRQAKDASRSADSSYALAMRVANTQERSAKIETRAYLMIDGVTSSAGLGKFSCFQWELVNVGKTPAYNVLVQQVVQICTQSQFEKIRKDTVITRSGFTMGTGSKISQEVCIKERLTRRDYNLINRGELNLYFWVTIFYRDVFREQRYTFHSAVLRPKDGFIMYTKQHNDSN